MMNTKLCLVVVFYNPRSCTVNFFNNYSKTDNYVTVIVVDNTLNDDINYSLSLNIVHIQLGKNKGIAIAQNIGIGKAKELGFDYILFFDQDSEWDYDYPLKMYNEYLMLEKKEKKAVMLGPTLVNKETMKHYKQNMSDFSGCLKTNTLISSGTIASIKAFDIVGLYDSDLFIDFVDFEWCWRAHNKGYNVYKSGAVSLVHQVGLQSINVFGFYFIVSNPIRYFYSYRNYLWLCKRGYVPLEWKIRSGIKNLATIVLLPLICKGRWKDALSYLLKGLWAGLTKKSNGV